MNKIELLKDIIDYIDDKLDDVKEITDYDDLIDDDNEPNLYNKCPHCNSEEYDFIKELLEDAVMKVKCRKCENNYYTDFGK